MRIAARYPASGDAAPVPEEKGVSLMAMVINSYLVYAKYAFIKVDEDQELGEKYMKVGTTLPAAASSGLSLVVHTSANCPIETFGCVSRHARRSRNDMSIISPL